MLDALVAYRTESDDPDQDFWFTLDTVAWAGADLTLDLSARTIGRRPPERWRVTCRELRDSRLCFPSPVDHVSAADADHPLLLPFTAPPTELYFHGRPSSPAAVLGELI